MPTSMRNSVHVEGFHALHICPTPSPLMLLAGHVCGVLLSAPCHAHTCVRVCVSLHVGER